MKKNIMVIGPLLSRSGYGEQARFALRALRKHEDKYNIYINPTNWGKTSWLPTNDPERIWIEEYLKKTVDAVKPDEQGRHTVPLHVDVSLQIPIPN